MQGKKRSVDTLILQDGQVAAQSQSETYGQDSQKLLPTDLGQLTNDFLVQHFPEILNYDFTAKEEEQFDRVAEGKADWVKTVDTFYKAFHPAIERVPKGKMDARLLGNDPKTDEPVYAKVSKLGPCIQIGTAEGEKPRFASLKPNQSLFTITLEEALQLFEKQPKAALMQIDGKDVTAGTGRFGPYIRYDGQFFSIPKGKTAESLTESDVRELMAKRAEQQKPIHVWGDVQVLQGRYGPYIKDPSGNYRIPKGTDVEAMTEDECIRLITKQKGRSKK